MESRSIKNILILIALVLTLFFFVSCGMDFGFHPIIGTWEREEGQAVFRLVFTEDYVQYSYYVYRYTKRRGGIKESRISEKQTWEEVSEFGFSSEFSVGTVFPDYITDTFTLSEDLSTLTWTRVLTDPITGYTQKIEEEETFTKVSDTGSISNGTFHGYEQFIYMGACQLDVWDDYHVFDVGQSSLFLYFDGSFMWGDGSYTIAEGTYSYDPSTKLITLKTYSSYLKSVVLRAVRSGNSCRLEKASGTFDFITDFGNTADSDFRNHSVWF